MVSILIELENLGNMKLIEITLLKNVLWKLILNSSRDYEFGAVVLVTWIPYILQSGFIQEHEWLRMQQRSSRLDR